MYRYERPQRGRLREFWQINVDIFGCDTYEADMECISSAISILKAYGADAEAIKAYKDFLMSFGKYEVEIETYFDQRMFNSSMRRIIEKPATFYENA